MESSSKKQKDFEKAFAHLQESIAEYDQTHSATVCDGLIHRFEFTFDLALKSMKEYLEEQGISFTPTFPKQLLKEAYRYQMIDDEQIWCNMLSSRNQTSHIYDESTAQRIAKAISRDYVSVLLKLKKYYEN